jgi:hypothetical protein
LKDFESGNSLPGNAVSRSLSQVKPGRVPAILVPDMQVLKNKEKYPKKV